MVNGRILNFTEATNWMGEVIATGPFSYFWLTNGDICALCGPKTMITFIITPLVGLFFTFFFSILDIAIRGEAARKPLFAKFLQIEDAETEHKELPDDVEDKDVEVEDVEKVPVSTE